MVRVNLFCVCVCLHRFDRVKSQGPLSVCLFGERVKYKAGCQGERLQQHSLATPQTALRQGNTHENKTSVLFLFPIHLLCPALLSSKFLPPPDASIVNISGNSRLAHILYTHVRVLSPHAQTSPPCRVAVYRELCCMVLLLSPFKACHC